MTINLRRIDDNYLMEAENENGNTLIMDGSKGIGGGESAMRPMQTVLSAMGGCSSIDVISLLRKQRQNVEDLRIRIDADREADKVPALFTAIRIHFVLYGDIDPNKAERAVNLSMEKYCSVAMILQKSAKISWSWEIATHKNK